MRIGAPGIITSNPSSMQRLVWGKNPGKPSKKSVGGYIADLAGLGKCILLCGLCHNKFDAKAYGYVEQQAVPGHDTISNCDGCNAWGLVKMYMKKGVR